MDQALDWLIRLECASTEQQLQFNDWLNQDPAHRQAFLKARSIWDSPAVHHVARQIAGL
jgi:transmembrane sensor